VRPGGRRMRDQSRLRPCRTKLNREAITDRPCARGRPAAARRWRTSGPKRLAARITRRPRAAGVTGRRGWGPALQEAAAREAGGGEASSRARLCCGAANVQSSCRHYRTGRGGLTPVHGTRRENAAAAAARRKSDVVPSAGVGAVRSFSLFFLVHGPAYCSGPSRLVLRARSGKRPEATARPRNGSHSRRWLTCVRRGLPPFRA